jgi:hypothetical protein
MLYNPVFQVRKQTGKDKEYICKGNLAELEIIK